MSKYSEFFLSSKSDVVQLELLSINHTSFSKPYNIVRNAVNGVRVNHGGNTFVEYTYYPMRISSMGTKEDLDFGIRVQLGDLGEIIPVELDRVSSDDTFTEKPVVVYRTYRSDDLNEPLYGPLTLEITSFTFDKESSQFEAKAPSLNVNETGETYRLDRFPMLRGYL